VFSGQDSSNKPLRGEVFLYSHFVLPKAGVKVAAQHARDITVGRHIKAVGHLISYGPSAQLSSTERMKVGGGQQA